MADTSLIKTGIEPYVRKWLSVHLDNVPLVKCSVALPSGEGYRFDAVSQNGLIVGAFLCKRPKKRTGRENTGGVRKALDEVERLKQLPHTVKKFMIFMDQEFCSLIQRRAKRFGIEGIKMLVCKLPPEKDKLLQKILNTASNEQRAAE